LISNTKKVSIYMSTPYVESKRVNEFRLGIAKEIPKFPNDKATLQTLAASSLASLFIHYNNWAIRYISTRPRTVSIEATASTDPRWPTFGNEISALLDKVRRGEDLTPHLSLEPHSRGYTPASAQKGPDVDRWADKDFLLNVMGYHHLHLGPHIHPNGFAARTDDLIFARVSREHFTVVGIFAHSVFKRSEYPTEAMTKERERLWSVFDEHSSRGMAPSSIYIPSMIATSGHSMQVVRMAQEYARIVREIDPKLDDIEFVKELYNEAGPPCPKKPKLKWHLNNLDLGLLDMASSMFFVLRYGPN
jgi:hypothetical protein